MAVPSLRHLVLFAFKPEAGPAEVEAACTAFRALPAEIDEVQAFEAGVNVSPEQLDRGFSHAFLLTFADADACERYRVHPAHQRFVASLQPVLAKVLVFDYYAA
ncbi:Dabb family protein [Chitinimonas koreensis]|uniref:Dabb family protein n=1 Tax=Chitinimonas koreensis TaxID=356302 RepID=UPI00048C0264|nr:Dabb family protein [Chitinimonas koreensis]QNM95235.1 Dabb family protein [Chitinimonas koreensis]